MKISFNWLNQYIDINDYRSNLSELSQLLTQAGLEVEDMVDPSEHWDKVVVGRLVEVGKHPDADKLTLCQVDVGQSENLQIVCGAKNHKTGDLVAVAQVGAVLYGDFKIKKSKIRGVESFGMLCSESELGLADESEGILILEPGLQPGSAVAELEAYANVVFELNVTPNRADCLSHLGLARELSTLLDRPVTLPESELSESGKDVNQWMQVELKDSEACPRYCGRMISGVKIGPSPDWLKKSLAAIGLNSVNNVVDVTNYVLFEYGQPLHAFDYSQVQGEKILIEKAKSGEKFTTLDGTEVELTNDDLVIRDGSRAVALAGVVGGKNSGVSDSTMDIFLESAFFAAEGVRRSSRAHGIETDSCYRFSRGVDPEQTLNALNRAAHLIVEVAGGAIQPGCIDIYPEPLTIAPIKVTTEYVAERLGLKVSDQDFLRWMQRLNCSVDQGPEGFKVTPPAYRWDLRIKEDLVEEYARLYGYDKIQEKLPLLDAEPSNHVFKYDFSNRVISILNGMGIHQGLNYAFISGKQNQEIWGGAEMGRSCGLLFGDSPIKLLNPISEELSVMRESLLPSLFKNLVYNSHHGLQRGRLFELAPSHHKQGDKFVEEDRLAFCFWGQNEGLWQKAQKNVVVFELKAAVETLLRSIGAKNWRWDTVKPEQCPPGFHPSQTALLFYEGQHVGILGTTHPLLLEQQKIRTQVAWAEFNFAAIGSRQPRSPQFKPLAKFPAVERDIAMVAEDTVTAAQMGSEIRKAAGPLLQHCEIFDVYQNQELKEAGRKSVAFRLRFQSDKETLKDNEVNALRDKVVNSLSQKLGLEIR
jgi:phenylalanyl-tRNA synthetase beta chain